jgi:peptidoglycan/LPS O-acetylase OafA/YrhL
MDGLLGLLWVVLICVKRPSLKPLAVLCLGLALVSFVADVSLFVTHSQEPYPFGLLCKFFTGASLRLWQDRVPASSGLCLGLVAAVLVSAIDPLVFGLVYRVAIAYVVIYFALVPAGPIRIFNRMGDYSYGIYIYAFPTQQAIVYLWKGVGPIALTLLAFAISFAFAFASWHLVEERSLKLKGFLQRRRQPRTA